MEKKSPLVPSLGIFLLFFLVVFLLREVSITGKSTGTIIISNNAPILVTFPVINDSSPNTNRHILCLPGQYSDPDNHPKVDDYFKWYKNNVPVVGGLSPSLDLSLPGNGDANDRLRCSQRSTDGFSNSSWYNSSEVIITQTVTTTVLPSSGGSSGSTTTVVGCQADYSCTSWLECIDGIQYRECTDLNGCSFPVARTETRFCVPTQQPAQLPTTTIEQETADIIESYSIISIVLISLAFILFLILLVTAIILSRKHAKPFKTKMSSSQQIKNDMLNYIRQALDRGYSPEQIEEALLKAGWPKDIIKSGFDEII